MREPISIGAVIINSKQNLGLDVDKIDKVPAVIGVSDRCEEGNPFANTGNLMHAVAARKILGDYVNFSSNTPWTDEEVERINANHSHLVVVFANAIRLGGISNDMSLLHGVMRENIERVHIPVVPFGLGAQSAKRLFGDDELIVAAETKALMQLLGERCRGIAVRGAFTAEVLERWGVRNAEVLGCQSAFWHLSPHFPVKLRSLEDDLGAPIGFSYTGALREWQLIKFAMNRGAEMIGQQHHLEFLIKNGLDTTDEYETRARGMKRLYDQKRFSQEEYEVYIREYFHIFYNLDAWLEYVKKYQFFFGTRFHGGMTALQAGVPALWVRHDTRTDELCDHLKLPSIPLNKAAEFKHIEQYWEATDYSEFIAHYPKNYRKLYDYLARAGVPSRLQKPYRDIVDSIGPRRRTRIESAVVSEFSKEFLTALSTISERVEHVEHKLDALMGASRDASGRASCSGDRTAIDRQRERAAEFKNVPRPTTKPEERALGDAVQRHGNTTINRYPLIFKAAADHLRADEGAQGARVLSFGCSTGEEAITLAQHFFTRPSDRIVGVDVVPRFIDEAVQNNPDPARLKFALSSEETLGELGPFDAIFAMSVLCVWPESKDVEDISNLMPFAQFEQYVTNLDTHLKVGGLLILYNASFRFGDTKVFDRYQVEPVPKIENSGFVKKFGKNNKSLRDGSFDTDIIFRKLR